MNPVALEPPLIVVIVPCYNESAVIDRFGAELTRQLHALSCDYRVIFVDDGSTDGTLGQLNRLAEADARVVVYSLSRNFGHQTALTAGLDVADGDAIIMMDADLQHPPSLIPALLEQWRAGADIVSAVRADSDDAGWFKRVSSQGFYSLVNRISDTPIAPGAADFCLLSRRAAAALRAMPERHRFLRGMVAWIGFPRVFVRFTAPPRTAGQSKYTFWKMAALAFDAIFSFSTMPMKLATRMGLALLVPGVAYVVFLIVRYVTGGTFERGWSSMIGVLLIVGGIQLVFIGLVGEYLAKVFEETKRRPLYFFKQTPPESRSDGHTG